MGWQMSKSTYLYVGLGLVFVGCVSSVKTLALSARDGAYVIASLLGLK